MEVTKTHGLLPYRLAEWGRKESRGLLAGYLSGDCTTAHVGVCTCVSARFAGGGGLRQNEAHTVVVVSLAESVFSGHAPLKLSQVRFA